MAGKEVKDPAEQGAHSVATCEEQREALIAELERVLCLFGQFIKKDELLPTVLPFGIPRFFSALQAFLHKPVDQLMDFATTVIEVLARHEPIPFVEGPSFLDPALSLIKICAKLEEIGLVDTGDSRECCMSIVILSMYGVSIKKLCDGVESKVVEERLKIDGVGPALDSRHHPVQKLLCMPLREIQIGYLFLGELWPHQSSRVFPYAHFGSQDCCLQCGNTTIEASS